MRTFLVGADITVNVSLEVEADSAEDAVNQVKNSMAREDVLAHAQGEDFNLTSVMEKQGDDFVEVEVDEELIEDA